MPEPTTPSPSTLPPMVEDEAQLLETLLSEPDTEGVEAAARELGLFADDQIIFGQDDEAGALLDYYLFEKSTRDEARIAAFIASPPDDLSERQSEILAALDETRFSLFEVKSRPSTNRSFFEVEDVLDQEFETILHDATLPRPTPGEWVAMRLYRWGDNWRVIGAPVDVHPALKRFFVNKASVNDLATALPGHEGIDSERLDTRVLLRTLIAARAAHEIVKEKGGTLKTRKRPPRSLKKRPRRGRKK